MARRKTTDLEQDAGIARAIAKISDIENKHRCEHSLLHFIKYVWPIVDPGTKFQTGWPLEAVCEHLEAVTAGYIRRLLINVPPGSSKSTSVYMWIAWLWGPKAQAWMRCVAASYNERLQMRDNLRLKKIITHPRFKRLWPTVELDPSLQSQRKIGNTDTGWRLATSVGGVSIGERGDIFVADDPNSIDTESDIVRKATNIWWTEVVPTRLNDPKNSAIVLIQQRLHEEDCTGVTLANDMGFTHLCIPALYEPKRYYRNCWAEDEFERPVIKTFVGENAVQFEPDDVFWEDPRTQPDENFWPLRFPQEVLDKYKKDLGPIGFAGQFGQSPVPRGGAIIGRDQWQLWERADYGNVVTIVAALDTSFSSKNLASNDPSAITVWGLSREPILRDGKMVHGDKYIMMFAMQTYSSFDELAKLVHGICTADRTVIPDIPVRFCVDRLLIENSAVARPVAIELERMYNVSGKFSVDLINVGRLDKVSRVNAIQHFFNNGMVYAPNKRWADEVMDQLTLFPLGKHDDLVDTVSLALGWFRANNWLLTKDEHDAEVVELTRYRPRRLQALYPA
jgi:predicted phage terminase large subunit-like protein